jgi:hypothetical protein
MENIYYLLNPWWEGRAYDSGRRREEYLKRLLPTVSRRQVEILIGSRRVGKTTLLRQVISDLIASGIPPNEICYLALDHPAFSATTIADHLKLFRKLFSHSRDKRLYLFLDEVQDIPDWEKELKAIYDTEQVKIFCSGSTSALIARQGGKLTGRQIVTTVFPLSFSEFLDFRDDRPSLSEDYRYESLVNEYLVTGGYPEQVISPSLEYLPNLLDDILARDLIRLFPIKKPHVLKDLLRLIASSVGSRTSYNRLAKLLGLSLDTVKEYIGYLESAFVILPLAKWTTSHSERVYAQRKLYLWDLGMKTVFTGKGDEGARAENAVFMALRRCGRETGYYAESELEVDFVLNEASEPLPLEVKMIDAVDPRDKRLSGLKMFLRRFPGARRSLLVTRTATACTDFHGVPLDAVPLWRFLLDPVKYIEV